MSQPAASPRPGRGPAPHRLPARADPRVELPGQGLPDGGGGARRAAHRGRRPARLDRGLRGPSRASGTARPRWSSSPWPARSRSTWRRWRRARGARCPVAARSCARRSRGDLPPALGLVRRRFTDRRDGADGGRAGPRVRGPDRPLPPADRRERPDAERLRRELDVVRQVNAAAGSASACSPASRSTCSPTARSTRSPGCWRSWTSSSPACTPSCGCRRTP